jgi:hypothetical protein
MNTQNRERQEGEVTKQIEHRTAQVPSVAYLALAGAAMAGSALLFLSGKRETGIFVGLWPLAWLTIGNYNKLVKLLGSEPRESHA